MSLGLADLPAAPLSEIIIRAREDHASLRSTSSRVRLAVDAHLEDLSAADCRCFRALGTLLAGPLGGLKCLTLDVTGPLRYTSYAQLAADAPSCSAALASLSQLSSLSLGAGLAEQLGTFEWAWRLSQRVTHAAGEADEPAQAALDDLPCALARVYHIPGWLASPPRLSRLVLQGSASRGGGAIKHGPSPRPVHLWLPSAWCQLPCLELRGVALPGNVGDSIGRLQQLQELCVVGCTMEQPALELLLQQLSGCSLTRLALSHGGLSHLPLHGWSALSGLKDLDLSHNMLASLPGTLSCLQQLTALRLQHNQLSALPPGLCSATGLCTFDASHNWLSGAAGLRQLVAAWPALQELALQNVSDKRGALVLPQSLVGCRQLRQLLLGDNFELDFGSLVPVVEGCKALRRLQLSHVTNRPPAGIKELLRRHKHLVVDW